MNPAKHKQALTNDAIEDPLKNLKALLVLALEQNASVGRFLAMFFFLFWPKSNAVWMQIKAAVEKAFGQPIDGDLYILKKQLSGLQAIQQLYLKRLETKDKEAISVQFKVSNSFFIEAVSLFQNKRYEWPLLPLFSVFAAMHIAFLRDGAIFGKEWGWSAAEHEAFKKETTATINNYIGYLNTAAENRRNVLVKAAPSSAEQQGTALFNDWNPYRQQKTLFVDDCAELFKRMDPSAYPKPIPHNEIHFDSNATPREVLDAYYVTSPDSKKAKADLTPFNYVPDEPAEKSRVHFWRDIIGVDTIIPSTQP